MNGDCVVLMRVVVIGMLIAIIASLGSALVYIFQDQGEARYRAVKALTLRVALSLTLFLILMGGQYFGLISQRL